MNPDEDRRPSKPLRNWLLAWHIHTGDPLQVIATGFDLPVELVADLLGPRPPLMLGRVIAERVCAKIRVSPAVFWSRRGNVSGGDCSQVDEPWTDLPANLADHFRA